MGTELAVQTGAYVPVDYDDLFRNYYWYVVRLVTRAGMDPQNAEDAASAILLKFYEHDVLNDFEADYSTEYQGRQRNTKFRTFLSSFVLTYVQHHRDRQRIHYAREFAVLDDESAFNEDTLAYIEKYEGMSLVDLVTSVLKRLEERQTSAKARIDVSALFVRVVEQTTTTGRIDYPALSAEFGISQTALRRWVTQIRMEIDTVLEY